MEQFLQNHAIYLMVGAFVVAAYFFIKSVNYDKRYGEECDDFKLCWGFFAFSTIFWGGISLLLLLTKDWIGFTGSYAAWVVFLTAGITSYFVGKFSCKGIKDSLIDESSITQRELDESIRKAKEKMNIR